LIIGTAFFAQRWREAANASQSDYRFHSHTREELEHFERVLSRRAASKPRRGV
jgi:hypothetical protein